MQCHVKMENECMQEKIFLIAAQQKRLARVLSVVSLSVDRFCNIKNMYKNIENEKNAAREREEIYST